MFLRARPRLSKRFGQSLDYFSGNVVNYFEEVPRAMAKSR
jgi:hypothetical protein